MHLTIKNNTRPRLGLGAALALLGCACVLPDARLGDQQPAYVCGNAWIEPGEQCDSYNLGTATCSTAKPGTGGRLSCFRCQLDTTQCVEPAPGAVCGNGKLERPSEECDLQDLGGASCELAAPGRTGVPICRRDCVLDLMPCVLPTTCGDLRKDPGEDCDGSDFGGLTCSAFVPGSSAPLSCYGNCKINSTLCLVGHPEPACGNGVKEPDELCDGTDLGGQTCQTLQPGTSGVLKCNSRCMFDTLMCLPSPGTAPANRSGTGGSGGGRGGTGG